MRRGLGVDFILTIPGGGGGVSRRERGRGAGRVSVANWGIVYITENVLQFLLGAVIPTKDLSDFRTATFGEVGLWVN